MRIFSNIAAVLLALIAVLQALRFAMGWPLVVDGFAVPTWASAVACIVAAWIAIGLWREARR